MDTDKTKKYQELPLSEFSLIKRAEILEQHHCSSSSVKKKLFTLPVLVISILTLVFFAFCMIYTGLYMNKMINAFQLNEDQERDQQDFIDRNTKYCKIIAGHYYMDLISIPISFLLTVFFMFLYWRRSCCLTCFMRRPAPPMVIHPFKKHDRLMPALVYAALAHEVMNIITDAIFNEGVEKEINRRVKDPSGVVKLLFRIYKMSITALSYYPPLVAFCANSVVINMTACFYMLLKIAINVTLEGNCIDFDNIEEDHYTSNQSKVNFLGKEAIPLRLIKDIPFFFSLSIVTATLCYRSAESFIALAKEKQSKYRLLVNEDLRFFSASDLLYCYDLFRKRKLVDPAEPEPVLSQKQKIVKKLKELSERHIYRWDPHFRYSARVVCCHVVASLALYYLVMLWISYGYYISKFDKNSTDLFNALINLVLGTATDIEVTFDLFTSTIEVTHNFTGWTVTAIFAYIICTIQSLLGFKSVKYSLLKFYEGKHDSIGKPSSNVRASIGNTTFAGFVVGYLLNGFVFIWAMLYIIFLVAYLIIDQNLWDEVRWLVLKLLPVFITLLLKKIFNLVAAKFFFLQERGALLALDNFRFYSIFVYTMFFFDCVIGGISALVRLVFGLIGGLLFMPRIGYSCLGRQIERFDAGFSTSVGYYQMEAAHTNPVLITFCTFLYYKRLVNKRDEFNSHDIIQIVRNRRKNTDKVEPVNKDEAANKNLTLNEKKKNENSSIAFDCSEEARAEVDDKSAKNQQVKTEGTDQDLILNKKKIYKQRVVNRWAVAVTLINNFKLVVYRKKTSSIQNIKLF